MGEDETDMVPLEAMDASLSDGDLPAVNYVWFLRSVAEDLERGERGGLLGLRLAGPLTLSCRTYGRRMSMTHDPSGNNEAARGGENEPK